MDNERALLKAGQMMRHWPMFWPMPDGSPIDIRPVKLFRNGRNQAVRIPRGFELPGEDATIRQEGQRLIIEPVARKMSLLELLATLEPLDEEIGEIEDWPPRPVDL